MYARLRRQRQCNSDLARRGRAVKGGKVCKVCKCAVGWIGLWAGNVWDPTPLGREDSIACFSEAGFEICPTSSVRVPHLRAYI